MKNFALVVITVSMLHSNPAFSEEACCVRDSATLPVTMPAGQLTDKSLLVTNAFDNILNVSEVRDCPLNLGITHYQGNLNLEQYVDAIGKAYGVQPDAKLKLVRSKMHGILTEYVFKGSISSTGEETTDDDGDLFGQFTMNMRLLDNCPSRAATSNVKTAEIRNRHAPGS